MICLFFELMATITQHTCIEKIYCYYYTVEEYNNNPIFIKYNKKYSDIIVTPHSVSEAN